MTVLIEIIANIPDEDFSFEQRDLFIKAIVALFKGMFPSATEIRGESPITVTVDPMYEDKNES